VSAAGIHTKSETTMPSEPQARDISVQDELDECPVSVVLC